MLQKDIYLRLTTINSLKTDSDVKYTVLTSKLIKDINLILIGTLSILQNIIIKILSIKSYMIYIQKCNLFINYNFQVYLEKYM